MVTQNTDKNTGQDELYLQYNWFSKLYSPAVQKASDEFFLPNFQFILLGISKNINMLMDKEGYFVTKVRIDELHDMFFRVSEQAVAIILEKMLGHPNSKFNLNRVTDLEAKIITAFNDFMYSSLSNFMVPPPPTVKRANYDVIHLTFLIKDIKKGDAAKFIITIPSVMLKPDLVICEDDKFENEYLAETEVPIKIDIGSSRFKMIDVKNVEVDDIIVLENSNLEHMLLKYKNYEKQLNFYPDMERKINIETDNKGEEDMTENNINLWDSIEVDMIAQFDAIKMSLGELKKVDEGLVVDISSIFNNKVTLKVDDKSIARGELVIVNDRYGVKVTEVLAEKYSAVMQPVEENNIVEEKDDDEEIPQEEVVENIEEAPQENSNNEEDEFDYSDFELEDEDI